MMEVDLSSTGKFTDLFVRYAILTLVVFCVGTLHCSAQGAPVPVPDSQKLQAKLTALLPNACDPTDPDSKELMSIITNTAKMLQQTLKNDVEAKKKGSWSGLTPEEVKILEEDMNRKIQALGDPCANRPAQAPVVSATNPYLGQLAGAAGLPGGSSASTINNQVIAEPKNWRGNQVSAGALASGGISGRTHLTIHPVSVVFPKQAVGNASQTQTIIISNVGSENETVELLPPFIDSQGRESLDFVQTPDGNCDGPIAVGSNCKIQVVFSPTRERVAAAELHIISASDFPGLKLARANAEAKRNLLQAAEAETANKRDGVEQLERELASLENSHPSKDDGPAQATLKQRREAITERLKAADDELQRGLRDFSTVRQQAADAHSEFLKIRSEAVAASPRVQLSGSAEGPKYNFARLVAGSDASAATSKSVTQTYLLDFFLSAPLRLRGPHHDPLESSLFGYFNPRITSVPQEGNSADKLKLIRDIFNPDLTQSLTKVTHGLDLTAGLELPILKPRNGIPWSSSAQDNSTARLGVSFIFGGGATTPFSNANSITFAKIDQSVKDAFPAETKKIGAGKTYIAFVSQERSRFYRKYYAGVRLKTYFFSRTLYSECDHAQKGLEILAVSCPAALDQFPGQVDFTVGQDEMITGGMLRHWVLRVDAVYPVPGAAGLHVIGSMNLALRKNTLSLPINVLASTPTEPAPSDANTFRIVVRPQDRDIFRLGIGLDLGQFLRKKESTTNAAAEAQQSQAAASPSQTATAVTNAP